MGRETSASTSTSVTPSTSAAAAAGGKTNDPSKVKNSKGKGGNKGKKKTKKELEAERLAAQQEEDLRAARAGDAAALQVNVDRDLRPGRWLRDSERDEIWLAVQAEEDAKKAAEKDKADKEAAAERRKAAAARRLQEVAEENARKRLENENAAAAAAAAASIWEDDDDDEDEVERDKAWKKKEEADKKKLLEQRRLEAARRRLAMNVPRVDNGNSNVDSEAGSNVDANVNATNKKSVSLQRSFFQTIPEMFAVTLLSRFTNCSLITKLLQTCLSRFQRQKYMQFQVSFSDKNTIVEITPPPPRDPKPSTSGSSNIVPVRPEDFLINDDEDFVGDNVTNRKPTKPKRKGSQSQTQETQSQQSQDDCRNDHLSEQDKKRRAKDRQPPNFDPESVPRLPDDDEPLTKRDLRLFAHQAGLVRSWERLCRQRSQHGFFQVPCAPGCRHEFLGRNDMLDAFHTESSHLLATFDMGERRVEYNKLCTISKENTAIKGAIKEIQKDLAKLVTGKKVALRGH